MGIQNGTATWEDSLAVSYKAKRILSHKRAIVLRGVYPTNLKTYVHTKRCTQVFIAVLFTVIKKLEETKASLSKQMSQQCCCISIQWNNIQQ